MFVNHFTRPIHSYFYLIRYLILLSTKSDNDFNKKFVFFANSELLKAQRCKWYQKTLRIGPCVHMKSKGSMFYQIKWATHLLLQQDRKLSIRLSNQSWKLIFLIPNKIQKWKWKKILQICIADTPCVEPKKCDGTTIEKKIIWSHI